MSFSSHRIAAGLNLRTQTILNVCTVGCNRGARLLAHVLVMPGLCKEVRWVLMPERVDLTASCAAMLRPRWSLIIELTLRRLFAAGGSGLLGLVGRTRGGCGVTLSAGSGGLLGLVGRFGGLGVISVVLVSWPSWPIA
jgi:hypothetical protein